jgi:hypothetical protein
MEVQLSSGMNYVHEYAHQSDLLLWERKYVCISENYKSKYILYMSTLPLPVAVQSEV